MQLNAIREIPRNWSEEDDENEATPEAEAGQQQGHAVLQR